MIRTEYYHCEYCLEVMPHNRSVLNHVLHLILTVLTGGLWVVVWFLLGLGSGRITCGGCGNTPFGAHRAAKKADLEHYQEHYEEYGPQIGERRKVKRGEHKGKFGVVSENCDGLITISDKAGRTITVPVEDIA